MSLGIILYIIITHFIFDWILQPRIIAKEKTWDLKIATFHASIVGFPLLFVLPAYIALFYVCLHAIQDRYLYNLLPQIWDSGDAERNMVNHTALDQIIHLCILFTMVYYFA